MSVLDTINQTLPDLFRVIDLLGVLLNGILGGRIARIKRFDAVGFMVLAIMCALAGGMLRDIMLDQGPPVALTDHFYLGTALVGALIAMLWRLNSRFWRIALVVADGTVLGCWAATGALKTLNAGLGVGPAILLGIMTAVGGGMIRDISAGMVPQVFGGNNLYATPAFVSAAIMAAFGHSGLEQIGMLVATIVGSSFTVLAHWRKWQLPSHNDWTLTMTATQLRALLRLRSLDEREVKKITEDNSEQLVQTRLRAEQDLQGKAPADRRQLTRVVARLGQKDSRPHTCR